MTVAGFTPVSPGEVKHHTVHFLTDPYTHSFAIDENPREMPNRLHMVVSEKAQRLCPCHIFFIALTGNMTIILCVLNRSRRIREIFA